MEGTGSVVPSDIIQPMTISPEWDRFLDAHPDAHLLQTSPWGKLKEHFGWHAETVQADGAGAMVLFRRLPLGFTLAYLPMGPVPANPNALEKLLPALDSLCRRRRAILLKLEPDALDDERIRSEM
jgi:peptidoglycan pentaglycine glycine transferase (the first glycine)